MRSSKSRSRSKANRPRTLGNIINRVFDSSGPEGKVRGTPQQIIEKYQMLAGDAQRSNDRVAAENFSQHAEHYTRMLAEAQREMAAEQEQRQQSQQGQQNHQNGSGGNRNERADFRNDRPEGRNERSDQNDSDQPYSSGFAVVGEADTSLVDLPESNRQQQPRRETRPDGQSGQPRRNDNRRDDRPREDRPREDRPREDRPRDDRPRENRREQTSFEQREQPVFVTAEQPVTETREAPVVVASEPAPVEAPRFESPAQLVAQVEKAASKPRAPKPEVSSDAPKPARAPRARKPKPAGNPEAAE